MEFTGIRGRPERATDTAQERYAKMKDVAQKFRIIQFGFTLFLPNAPDQYVAYPFNAYVMQDECFRQGFIGMEVSALQFLTEHGMDFNKWIKESVSYIGSYDEEKLRNEENKDSEQPIELSEKKLVE